MRRAEFVLLAAVHGLLLVVFAFLVGTLSSCARCEGALIDCYEATCRISDTSGKPLGTACSFRITQDKVWLLTNAHVTEGHDVVGCEFWHLGHQSPPLAGTVVWRQRNDRIDASIVTVSRRIFGDDPPPAIPLAPAGRSLRAGELVHSVGCANGAWATGWRGHVLGYAGPDLRFLPAPAGGRSGSAIFDAEAEQIVGLLYARTADDRQGMACSLAALYAALPMRTQCPGGQCPIPRPNRQFQLFGRQELNESPQGGLYPGIPPATYEPPRVPDPVIETPMVPIDHEARARIDAVERAVAAIERRLNGVDSSLNATASKAEDAAESVVDVQAAAEEKVSKVEERLTGLGNLIDQAKGEGAEGVREVARSVVWGIVKAYGWPIGGALGLAFFLLWRRIDAKREAGEPLLYERALARLRERAGGFDEDSLVRRVADRVGERLHPEASKE